MVENVLDAEYQQFALLELGKLDSEDGLCNRSVSYLELAVPMSIINKYGLYDKEVFGKFWNSSKLVEQLKARTNGNLGALETTLGAFSVNGFDVVSSPTYVKEAEYLRIKMFEHCKGVNYH